MLDDGTGAVRTELAPFFDTFRQMARPRSGIYWRRKPHVQAMLRALAAGEVELTHDDLNQLI